jgi:hypothetical protein
MPKAAKKKAPRFRGDHQAKAERKMPLRCGANPRISIGIENFNRCLIFAGYF